MTHLHEIMFNLPIPTPYISEQLAKCTNLQFQPKEKKIYKQKWYRIGMDDLNPSMEKKWVS